MKDLTKSSAVDGHGLGRRLVALTFLVAVTGLWASPAHATAGGRSGSTVQPSQDGPQVGGPAGTERGELDLGMVAATAGSALAVGILMVCRPLAARRRAVLRFRAELLDADVDSICSRSRTG